MTVSNLRARLQIDRHGNLDQAVLDLLLATAAASAFSPSGGNVVDELDTFFRGLVGNDSKAVDHITKHLLASQREVIASGK